MPRLWLFLAQIAPSLTSGHREIRGQEVGLSLVVAAEHAELSGLIGLSFLFGLLWPLAPELEPVQPSLHHHVR